MHPKIEAVFHYVLPLPEEEIWNKMKNENWFGWGWILSHEYWMNWLESNPIEGWRIKSAKLQLSNYSIEYYDGNFCIISNNNVDYALLWNPGLVE